MAYMGEQYPGKGVERLVLLSTWTGHQGPKSSRPPDGTHLRKREIQKKQDGRLVKEEEAREWWSLPSSQQVAV
jgi:hypothetical protein